MGRIYLFVFGGVIPACAVLYVLWRTANFFLRPYETGLGRVTAKSDRPEFVARGRYEYLLTLDYDGKSAVVMISAAQHRVIDIGQQVLFVYQVGRFDGALDAHHLA